MTKGRVFPYFCPVFFPFPRGSPVLKFVENYLKKGCFGTFEHRTEPWIGGGNWTKKPFLLSWTKKIRKPCLLSSFGNIYVTHWRPKREANFANGSPSLSGASISATTPPRQEHQKCPWSVFLVPLSLSAGCCFFLFLLSIFSLLLFAPGSANAMRTEKLILAKLTEPLGDSVKGLGRVCVQPRRS